MRSTLTIVLCCLYFSITSSLVVPSSTHTGSGEGDFTLRYNAETESYVFSDSPDDGAIAVQGSFRDDTERSGWSHFAVFDNTTELQPGSSQVFYAAGYAEGAIMQTRIYQSWYNQLDANVSITDPVAEWVQTHIQWMNEEVKSNPLDPYWRSVGNVMSHLKGLSAGYSDSAPSDEMLSFIDIFLLNFVFEVWDVELALNTERNFKFRHGGCTAMVRVTATDAFVGHNTWSTLETMLRTFKTYALGGLTLRFSSYPGILHSGDDFYVNSNGFLITETTIDIYDEGLYKALVPSTVSEWIRATVANRLAKNSTDWARTFCRHNSGTYNNQWMILNATVFRPGMPFPNGAFVVLEQLPGMCEFRDMTANLNTQGYWISYNIPYFQKTYDASGSGTMAVEYGSQDGKFFIWNETVRFHQLQDLLPTVVDLPSMQQVMRYNNYKADKWSTCGVCSPKYTAMFALAPRGDLNPSSAKWGPMMEWVRQQDLVATDAKVSSVSMMLRNLSATVVAGPTTSHNLPPFDWDSSPFSDLSHLGQPNTFDFDWVGV